MQINNVRTPEFANIDTDEGSEDDGAKAKDGQKTIKNKI